MTPIMIIIGVIVVVLAVGAGTYFVLSSGNSPSQHTTTVATSNLSTSASTQATTSTYTTASSQATSTAPAQPSANSTNSYPIITQSQAISLVGSGGLYTSSSTNQSRLKQLPTYLGITGEYIMWYNITSPSPLGVVNNVVLATQNQTGTYAYLYTAVKTFFNQTYLTNAGATGIVIMQNVTSNGMTYSYSTYTSVQNGQQLKSVVIIGKKGNYVTYAVFASQASDTSLTPASAAAALSGNI